MTRSVARGFCMLAGLVLVWGSSTAKAELSNCGGIFLKADAKCEYRKAEECMTQCMPQTVQTSCVAKVYKSCETKLDQL